MTTRGWAPASANPRTVRSGRCTGTISVHSEMIDFVTRQARTRVFTAVPTYVGIRRGWKPAELAEKSHLWMETSYERNILDTPVESCGGSSGERTTP